MRSTWASGALCVSSLVWVGCSSGSASDAGTDGRTSTDSEAAADAADVSLNANPFRPTQLEMLSVALRNATRGRGDPPNVPLAMLSIVVTPFFTAAQIGAHRG
jgi:hypothetical protein